jgi:hypothetical protein
VIARLLDVFLGCADQLFAALDLIARYLHVTPFAGAYSALSSDPWRCGNRIASEA